MKIAIIGGGQQQGKSRIAEMLRSLKETYGEELEIVEPQPSMEIQGTSVDFKVYDEAMVIEEDTALKNIIRLAEAGQKCWPIEGRRDLHVSEAYCPKKGPQGRRRGQRKSQNFYEHPRGKK